MARYEGMTDEQIQEAIMAESSSRRAQQGQQLTPDDKLNAARETQEKLALNTYHLRMIDAGAVRNPETGVIDANGIEPAIADFGANEYTQNMLKISQQYDEISGVFGMIGTEERLTESEKELAYNGAINRARWPMHSSSIQPPKKKAEIPVAEKQAELRKSYKTLLDRKSSFAENVKVPMKGFNKVVPLALLDVKGNVARAATPEETVEYLATVDAIQNHPLMKQYGGMVVGAEEGDTMQDLKDTNKPRTREEDLAEFKNLGGSGTEAGRAYAKSYLMEKK